MRIGVIGAGIVGLATAREILRRHQEFSLTIFDKESGPGQHQSTHNSGVLHAGVYYKPGSLKAQLSVKGIRRMTSFCREKQIAHEVCGKIIVATNEAEVQRLRELKERGIRNGLTGLRWLNAGELHELEPHAAGLAGLHVPEEGIVDYKAVCCCLLEDVCSAGGKFMNRAKVLGMTRRGNEWRVSTTAGIHAMDYIVNCAGLFCDLIAELAGVPREMKIVPFRGEYYQLTPKAQNLVRNLIYPVPDPSFPFLGVHFTRLIHGGVEAGPNAVLAFAREGYSKSTISLRDMMDSLLFPGLWKFLLRYPSMCWEEMIRSFNKQLFAQALRKLVPEISENDLVPGSAGVRAQAMLGNGTLVQDFWLVQRPGAMHVLNAPSPAATASLAIAEYVVNRMTL